MTSITFEQVKSAITNKQQIHAEFDGLHREMCPHVLGYQNGVEQALFCQFGGQSKSQGEITPANAKWRCIPIEGLSNVKIVNGEWHSIETKGVRRTTCVNEAVVEVPYKQ